MKDIVLLVSIVIALFGILWLIAASGGRGLSDPDSPWEPPVIVHDVITPDECKYIIDLANPGFSRSTVVGENSVDSSRTSETAWVSKNDPVAQKLLAKALELTGKTMAHCEDIQVVKYTPGTYYRAHHDSCCDASDDCTEFAKDGGQRVGTLLVYLNSEFEDGETHFPDYGDLKMKANPGSAIFFRPLGSDDGKCHPKALHAGLPISSGVKYVCNVWIREDEFR